MCTRFATAVPIADYLSLLDIGESPVFVGIPEEDLPALPPTLISGSKTALKGSSTGSKKHASEMLKLAARVGKKSWFEEMPMSKCLESIGKLERGESSLRIVLETGPKD